MTEGQSLRDKVAFAIAEAFPWPGELEQELADQMADALIARGLVSEPVYVGVRDGFRRQGEERIQPKALLRRDEMLGQVPGDWFHRQVVGHPHETYGPWMPGRA